MVTIPGTPTDTGDKKGKQFSLCEYKMELGKPYSQIVLYLCIESKFKETFDNNCETASSAEFKNQAKSIPFILEENGNVNEDTLDDFFNDFCLDYLNSTNSNNQEFSLNNETPIFNFRTTVSVSNQENTTYT